MLIDNITFTTTFFHMVKINGVSSLLATWSKCGELVVYACVFLYAWAYVCEFLYMFNCVRVCVPICMVIHVCVRVCISGYAAAYVCACVFIVISNLPNHYFQSHVLKCRLSRHLAHFQNW